MVTDYIYLSPTIWSHSFAYVVQTDVSRKVTIIETQREFGLDDRHALTMIPLRRAATPSFEYKDTYVHRYTGGGLHGTPYIHLELYRFYLQRPDVVPVTEERRKSVKWNPRRSHLRIISQIHFESRPQIFARRSRQSMVCRNRDNSCD